MNYILGFTGTRSGMTPEQKSAVRLHTQNLKTVHRDLVGLHGDCVGSDYDFDKI